MKFASPTGSSNQPLQDSIKIGFIFGTDSVAADLPVGDTLEIEALDQIVDRVLVWEVGFITQDQKGYAFQCGF